LKSTTLRLNVVELVIGVEKAMDLLVQLHLHLLAEARDPEVEAVVLPVQVQRRPGFLVKRRIRAPGGRLGMG
jgi:hypothetical protein